MARKTRQNYSITVPVMNDPGLGKFGGREAVRRLSGRALPAYVSGCPDLYVMVKRDGEETVIGLWNMFADSVLDGVVELDAPAGDVEFFNCTGRKDGDRLVIDEIPPFSFAGIRNRCRTAQRCHSFFQSTNPHKSTQMLS